MLFKSALVTVASGSLGGMTASHNKGGAYLRARVVPTNPATVLQEAVRGFVTFLSNAWQEVLTPDQRTSWDVYAANVPLINRLGDPVNVSGFNMYIRSNVSRKQAGFLEVDDAPTIFDIGSFNPPDFALDEPADEVDVTFVADPWVDEDDSFMAVYASRPQAQSVNFFKGPYQLAGTIDGDSTTAPTSPAAIALPFPVAVGQRVFFRVNVLRADGRLSSPFRGAADA